MTPVADTQPHDDIISTKTQDPVLCSRNLSGLECAAEQHVTEQRGAEQHATEQHTAERAAEQHAAEQHPRSPFWQLLCICCSTEGN